MNATDYADLMNWVGWLTALLIIAVCLTIVRVKELKSVRENTRGESETSGDSSPATDGTRR